MALLDLRYSTGKLAQESHRERLGVPKGEISDNDVSSRFGWTLLDALHLTFPELPILIVVLANSDLIDNVRVASPHSNALRTVNDGADCLVFQLVSEPCGAPAGDSCAASPDQRPSA